MSGEGTLIKLLAVGCGGFFGAISRYLLSAWVLRLTGDRFPWGTLAVNVLGCFLIGVLAQMALSREWLTPQWRLVLITGFLGSLTTFSTFGLETLMLLESGDLRGAVGNILLNVSVGLGAVILGRSLVQS